MVLKAFIHKSVDLLWYVLCRIKESLLLIILPVKCQVGDTITLPEVLKLGTCTVDHPCDLVGVDKLQVLYKWK